MFDNKVFLASRDEVGIKACSLPYFVFCHIFLVGIISRRAKQAMDYFASKVYGRLHLPHALIVALPTTFQLSLPPSAL